MVGKVLSRIRNTNLWVMKRLFGYKMYFAAHVAQNPLLFIWAIPYPDFPSQVLSCSSGRNTLKNFAHMILCHCDIISSSPLKAYCSHYCQFMSWAARKRKTRQISLETRKMQDLPSRRTQKAAKASSDVSVALYHVHNINPTRLSLHLASKL